MSRSRASRAVAAPRVVNVEDLRPIARRRLPRVVFDYLDGGAEGEVTLRENCRAFEEVTFRPRQAVPVRESDPRVKVLGFDLSFPALLAPVGYSRLMHPGGEVAAARAAGAAGWKTSGRARGVRSGTSCTSSAGGARPRARSSGRASPATPRSS